LVAGDSGASRFDGGFLIVESHLWIISMTNEKHSND